MNQSIIHNIIRQKVKGMNIENFYLQPTRLLINSVLFRMNLRNTVYILNNSELPENCKLTIISSDNVFETDHKQFEKIKEFGYQIFTDYLEIHSELVDPAISNFSPYYLEFLEIIPIKEP